MVSNQIGGSIMTVEKIKEMIDEMINDRISLSNKLNKTWTPENHEIINQLCVEGEILLVLRKRITDEESRELFK